MTSNVRLKSFTIAGISAGLSAGRISFPDVVYYFPSECAVLSGWWTKSGAAMRRGGNFGIQYSYGLERSQSINLSKILEFSIASFFESLRLPCTMRFLMVLTLRTELKNSLSN